MKTLLMICLSTALLLNATTSFAEQPVNKESVDKQSINKQPSETCKRPPEPPKDKNGHPLPPPKEHDKNHPPKGQPPHDSKHHCPPPKDKKIRD